MIEIERVSKSYNKGAVRAVNNVSLTVQSGEVFGFLGPNGAGKSTTIKMLMGILKPDSGIIKMDGLSTQEHPLEVKKKIGYVPDEPMFYDKMTGISYLHFIADIFSIDAHVRKQRIEALSQEFLLTDPLADVIASYSHGMKQKLGIIAALLHDPDIFILDEPLVGLDPKAAYILKKKMRELCNQGKTIFFSTHVMEVAEKICDKVAIIRRGELLAEGPFLELRKKAGDSDSSLEELFLELTDETDLLVD